MPKTSPSISSTPIPVPPTPWSIKLFYSEAIKLLKRRREIWILVILVVIFASSGSNSNDFNIPDGESDSEEIEQSESSVITSEDEESELIDPEVEALLAEETDEDGQVKDESDTDVFGLTAMTESPQFQRLPLNQQRALSNIIDNPLHVLSQVNWGWYLLFGVNVILLIIWAVVFGFGASAWVQASLTWAIFQESLLQPWRLPDAVKAGFKLIGSFVWLQLVPAFLAIVVVLISAIAVALIAAVLMALEPLVSWVVLGVGLLIFVYICALLYGFFKLSVVGEIAQRLVIGQALPAHSAFQQAFGWAKGMSFKFFRLGASEVLLALAIVIVPIVLLVVLAMLLVSQSMTEPNLGIIIGWVIFAILAVVAFFIFFLFEIGGTGLHVALWQMAWNHLASTKGKSVEVKLEAQKS